MQEHAGGFGEGVRTVFTVGASAFSFARFSAALSGYGDQQLLNNSNISAKLTHLVAKSLTSAY